MYPAPSMDRLHLRYTPRHHYILTRALSRREANPRHFKRFLTLFQFGPLVFGGPPTMADSTRIDRNKLIDIANRIGAAEDGMDAAQTTINNAQAAKDAAQAQAQALIAGAAAAVTDAQGKLAQATSDYKAANADLIAFVQALETPADPAAPAPAPAS